MGGKAPIVLSQTLHVWHLDGNPMKTSDDLEILGDTFSGTNKFDKHVQLRSQKCRKSMYSLNSIGVANMGLVLLYRRGFDITP